MIQLYPSSFRRQFITTRNQQEFLQSTIYNLWSHLQIWVHCEKKHPAMTAAQPQLDLWTHSASPVLSCREGQQHTNASLCHYVIQFEWANNLQILQQNKKFTSVHLKLLLSCSCCSSSSPWCRCHWAAFWQGLCLAMQSVWKQPWCNKKLIIDDNCIYLDHHRPRRKPLC